MQFLGVSGTLGVLVTSLSDGMSDGGGPANILWLAVVKSCTKNSCSGIGAATFTCGMLVSYSDSEGEEEESAPAPPPAASSSSAAAPFGKRDVSLNALQRTGQLGASGAPAAKRQALPSPSVSLAQSSNISPVIMPGSSAAITQTGKCWYFKSTLKVVDIIGNYSKTIVSIKTNLVTSNGELLTV